MSPWADVNGPIDLGFLGVTTPAAGQDVSGLDTPAWPVLLGLAGVVVAATLWIKLMKLVLVVGVLLVLGGAGLVYYIQNAVEIESRKESAQQTGTELEKDVRATVGDLAVDVTTKPGPYLVLGSGLLVVLGAGAALRSRA